ncbi:MAG: hypothetical protein AAF694_18600 [Bacteroidota bacterium]
MKHSLAIGYFLLAILPLTGQVEREDLHGEWLTRNDDSAYYRADTLELFQSENYPDQTYACEYVKWKKGEKFFSLIHLKFCKTPPTQSAVRKGDAIRLKRTPYGQVIRLTRRGIAPDQFKVLDYRINRQSDSSQVSKVLRLMRVDDLSEQKVYNYVEHLISKHFPPKASDAKPVIILNGYIVTDKDMLKEIRLAEVTSISYATKEQSTSRYGKQALYGVITISVPPKVLRRN